MADMQETVRESGLAEILDRVPLWGAVDKVLFKAKCKIRCYDSDSTPDARIAMTNAIGEIKIIRNDARKLHRVVMNRDQPLKVCTNHLINNHTEPKLHFGNRSACSYFIMDYTESKEPKRGFIVIHFPTEALCTRYMYQIRRIMTYPAPFVEERVKVLFRARCRLLSRYDSAYRVIEKYGVGEIIVLQNIKRKLYRIIIIREQTLEVCTNHIVHADTITQLHLGDPTACWYAIMDYTVIEQPRPGYIAIRFKTAALCAKYMAQIEDAKVQGNPGPYSPVNNEQKFGHEVKQYEVGFDNLFQYLRDCVSAVVLFKAICKISCYDSTDQAGKTNAIGEIKIIREDSRKLYRVVMNRDLCLTVCTDHVIDDDTDPQVHCGNRNVCSYFIMDYTESMHAEPRYVVIKFMTADLCATYMGHIGDVKAYPRFAC